MRRTLGTFIPCLAILALICGCPPRKKTVVEPPSPKYDGFTPGKALVKIPPEMYPDFSPGFDHRTNLIQAALYSKQYLEKKSSQQYFPYADTAGNVNITHDQAIQSIDAFIEVLQTAQSGQQLDQMIKQRFDVYQSKGYPLGPNEHRTDINPRWTPPDSGIVLFTGYYCPIFDARLKPDSEFKWPLYKKPDELVLDPTTMHYRTTTGQPFLTRAQIESGALRGRGLELCYLRDWFETYIVTIQGSAKLRMADGSFMEIGYAADNGYEYNSVGRALVQQNKIASEQLSLQGLINYFKQNPQERETAININPRYVFFMPRSGGPFGSLGVPVTPFRSVATDKDIFPRAGICFLNTQLPQRLGPGQIENRQYGGFALDQDTGGAIRAAGRCDVFMGTGDEWGELAGRTFSEGQLYYIYLKNGAGTPTAPATGATYSPAPPAVPPAEMTAPNGTTYPPASSARPNQPLTSKLPPG